MRLIVKDTPGGIEAEIAISLMRYGDPLFRSDALVFSWSAVALMIRSARVAGSIRSTTVLIPRRAMPIASRACFPSFSWVPGSWAVRVATAAASDALPRAVSAACCACSAAASAASRARFMKLTRGV